MVQNETIIEHGQMVVASRSAELAPAIVPIHAIVGLAGEVGEVAEMIKKYAWHGRALDHDQLELEIGDVLWYLHSLCESTGISLENAFRRNTEKIRKRHPNGFRHDYNSTVE